MITMIWLMNLKVDECEIRISRTTELINTFNAQPECAPGKQQPKNDYKYCFVILICKIHCIFINVVQHHVPDSMCPLVLSLSLYE